MPRHRQPPAAPAVLLTLFDHLLLPLGQQLFADRLAPLGVEISQSLTCCLFVFAHMLLDLTLCGFSPHELVHASGIGVLLEIPGVLMSIEHLHH